MDSIWEDLKVKLPALRAEHARLGRLIAAIEGDEAMADVEEIEGGAGGAESGRQTPNGTRVVKQSPTVGRDDFTGLSTSEAIKKYLTKMVRGNPKGPRDMAKAMLAGGRGDTDEEVAYANVASALKRLKANKEVQQVRRGEWGLTSWYTNKNAEEDA